jgi:hypothetical protein
MGNAVTYNEHGCGDLRVEYVVVVFLNANVTLSCEQVSNELLSLLPYRTNGNSTHCKKTET